LNDNEFMILSVRFISMEQTKKSMTITPPPGERMSAECNQIIHVAF
jgi:hypothetical protein